MLAKVIRNYWLALVRDVLVLGHRESDILTTLSIREVIAIIWAAPPGSSIRWFIDEGWSRESQLLANLQEQQAGVATMREPYQRPGLAKRQPDPEAQDQKWFRGDPYTWNEFDELQRKRYANAHTAPPGTTRVRTL